MLPSRDGVGPSCVGLTPGPWVRLIDFMVQRFPLVDGPDWRARMARGEVVDGQGRPVHPDQPYRPHGKLYYYRSLPPEPRVAAAEQVVFEDDWLVVADKPHFLPVTPSGRYLQETLLVRLRRRLGIDSLTPVHRIDRETAGLVLFCKQPSSRKHYQALFAGRRVHKTYQAIAPWQPALRWPLTRATVMLDSSDNFMQMREQTAAEGAAMAGPPAAPNAITTIDCLQVDGDWARYQLQPVTGQRHQLRVHMAALGLPILGDQIYPRHLAEGSDDLTNPLRLLAQRIEFVDPVTGGARCFESAQTLAFPGRGAA